nr:hypothetical protein [uncultured Sphingosinicella sp.]
MIQSFVFIALLSAPVAAAGPDPPPSATVSAMVMDVPSSPIQRGSDFEAEWIGVFYRCPDEATARRVIGAVRTARPASAEVALPLLAAGVASNRCFEVGDEYEWTDMPLEIEFEQDGQGLQLITGRDGRGRPVALVYRRGAC